MPTLLNEQDRTNLVDRLRRLTPEQRPKWGRLDAPRMLCHVTDQLRVALGEIPAAPVGNPLTRMLLKWLVVYLPISPPPGKVETAPEMLTTHPASWADDLRAAETRIERVSRGEARAVHPAFGPLSPAGWGRLSWKHLDHHLRQFGV